MEPRLKKLEANAQYATSVEKIIMPFLLSWCKIGQNHTKEALIDLHNMLNPTQEKNAFVLYQMALSLDMAGSIEEADKDYQMALSYSEKSYRFVKNAGNFYERVGKKDQARKLYTQYNTIEDYTDLFADSIARIDKQKPPPDRTLKTPKDGIIDVILEIVGTLYKNQLYREALGYLEMILYLDPENAQAHFLLGAYYEQSHQYDKSIAHFQKVRKYTDFYWQTQVNIAQAYYKNNNTREAKKLLRTLYEQRPFDYDAPLLLCDIYKGESNFKDATPIFDKIIASIPTPQPEHWYIFYRRGINYADNNNWPKAESDLRKALELQPGQPDVLNFLGYSLLEHKEDTQKATLMIAKALEQRPNSPQILDSMGWALYMSGDPKRALGYLEKALRLMPYDSTINDHVGDVYWRLGRKIEARFQWQHALSFSPEEQDLDEIQKKLDEGL